jgi:hypothetical protein
MTAAVPESWHDSTPAGLQGVVRSDAGEALADVELLVFPGSHSSRPLARLTTDRNGRFEGPPLAPGAYRVAVLKEGYGTLLTLVDLFRRHPIELILKPESLIDPERRESYPKESSWALRLPVRHPLRELAADWRVPVRQTSDRSEGLHLRLDHVFAFGGHSSGQAADVDGRQTEWNLEHAWDDRYRVLVAGRAIRFGESTADGESHSDEGLDLVFESRNTPLGSLALRGFYDRRSPLVFWAPTEAVREVASADYQGLDVEGESTFGGGRELSWRVGYRGSSADGSDRLGLTASYSMMPSARHRLRTVLRADSLTFADTPGTSVGLPPEGTAGNRVLRLNVVDRWDVSSNWSLQYGAGLAGFDGESGSLVTVPELGASWAPGPIRAEMGVRFHATDGDASTALVENLDGRFGYDFRVDWPLADRVVLQTSFREDPYVIRRNESFERRSLDPVTALGETGRQEARISLGVDAPAFTMQFSLLDGTSSGRHSVMARYGDFAAAWDRVPVAFQEARMDWTIPHSGSEISLEWNRMEEATASGPAVEQSMEWRLVQSLDGLGDAEGHWRLLLAWRLVDLDAPMVANGTRSLQQIRSGLRVSF